METKQGMSALFLYATEGIIVANELGEITSANHSADKLFGYEKGELTSLKIEALVPSRFASKHQADREKYAVNPHARAMGATSDLYGKRKDGSEFPIEISLSPFSNSDGKFVIAFVADITLRKQAEEKLKNYSIELENQVRNRTMILEEAIAELEQTKKDLKRALEKEKDLGNLKSRFVSMASHEFRTPLTTMMSSLSLISKYGELNDKENQAKHIQKIKTSIHNLTDILNDFLSLGRLEEGKVDNNPEEINLKLFIEEIIAEMQQMAFSGQKLLLEYDGNEVVNIDKKLLKNILFNLISNAIKFSPEESSIEIVVRALYSSIKLAVSDHGIGIPKEDQKQLFERFFRGHNATHIQGTGLGLNIVTKYTELLNGSIDFESEENKGTTFTIIIPQ